MNKQITGLFRLTAIGFAVLITFTAYWQIWAADSLAERSDNARLVYRQLQIKRGLIFAANGTTVLARNRKSTHDGQTIYTRRYPFRGLFAQVVGYNSAGQGRSGIELSYNDFLTSSNANLSTALSNLGDQLRGRTITGNNVITSLSVPAQTAAMQGLRGAARRGRRDPAPDRSGGDDGVDADLRPQPDQRQLREARSGRTRERRCSTARPRACTRRGRRSRPSRRPPRSRAGSTRRSARS